nr:gag pol polyprotein [Hymenolepis microstoma]
MPAFRQDIFTFFHILYLFMVEYSKLSSILHCVDTSHDLQARYPGSNLTNGEASRSINDQCQYGQGQGQEMSPWLQTHEEQTTQSLGQISRQAVKATTGPGYTPSRLLYVVGRNSKHRFLVDTGSEVSVIPRPAEKRCLQATGISLLAANNTKIPTYG